MRLMGFMRLTDGGEGGIRMRKRFVAGSSEE